MTLCRLSLIAFLALGGCANHPLLRNPGTIEQQRIRATVHDPYPDQNLGPFTDGGRPRDFLNALPEPVHNRIFADTWIGRR